MPQPYTARMSDFLMQSPENGDPVPRPTLSAAVVMQRERIDNRWQPWRWSLGDVVPHEDGFGTAPRLLFKNDAQERWLHPGFKVELYLGDAEGYYLNVTTQQPCFWVVWRMEEEPTVTTDPIAMPTIVTVSYHDAGRWLDAQESVEQTPMPASVAQWLQAFVDKHHVLETKRRQRPQSFKSLEDRFGNPARVSTDKNLGRGASHG